MTLYATTIFACFEFIASVCIRERSKMCTATKHIQYVSFHTHTLTRTRHMIDSLCSGSFHSVSVSKKMKKEKFDLVAAEEYPFERYLCHVLCEFTLCYASYHSHSHY